MTVKRKLGTTSDFINRAKSLDVSIELDIAKTSGLQVHWIYSAESPEALKLLKKAFSVEGIFCNHHFRKRREIK